METTTYSVPAISCGHCKMSIEGSVGALQSVENVDVNIDAKTVLVEGSASAEAVRAAIKEAGYEVVGV